VITAPLVQAVDWVTVDGDPTYSRPTTDDSGLDVLEVAEPWAQPPSRYLDVLTDLVDHAPGDPARCYRCLTQPVGWAEEARETTHGAEYDVTVWRTAVLVASPGGGPVSVQCDDCGPDVTPAPRT
jgi:hypothetical protein